MLNVFKMRIRNFIVLFYIVDGVLLPVVDVDGSDAAHQLLQLDLVEHLEEVQRNELVEPGQEVIHL
jgi:hypothetical protein